MIQYIHYNTLQSLSDDDLNSLESYFEFIGKSILLGFVMSTLKRRHIVIYPDYVASRSSDSLAFTLKYSQEMTKTNRPFINKRQR